MAIRKDTVQIAVEINGEQAGRKFGDLKKQVKQLYRELNLLNEGTTQFAAKEAEIKKINDKLAASRKRTRGVAEAMDKARTATGLLPAVINKVRIATLSLSASFAGFFALEKMFEFLNGLKSLGTELDIFGKKAETVLGDTLDDVSAKAAKNAHELGLTKGQYIDATAAMSDLLIPMGFFRKEAAGISRRLVDLSGALAEWSGGVKSTAEVNEVLSKSLLGNRAGLKGLGISISDADVKNRLAAKGMEQLTGQALQQAKALSTLELILEKSTDAQDAHRKNGDANIRTQARQRAEWEEIRELLATKLIPAYKALGRIFL